VVVQKVDQQALFDLRRFVVPATPTVERLIAFDQEALLVCVVPFGHADFQFDEAAHYCLLRLVPQDIPCFTALIARPMPHDAGERRVCAYIKT
jgi:hypothetical protein